MGEGRREGREKGRAGGEGGGVWKSRSQKIAYRYGVL